MCIDALATKSFLAQCVFGKIAFIDGPFALWANRLFTICTYLVWRHFSYLFHCPFYWTLAMALFRCLDSFKQLVRGAAEKFCQSGELVHIIMLRFARFRGKMGKGGVNK